MLRKAEAEQAFNEVDSTLDEAHRALWANEDQTAQTKFIEDPSAFDIYDIQMARGNILCFAHIYQFDIYGPLLSSWQGRTTT